MTMSTELPPPKRQKQQQADGGDAVESMSASDPSLDGLPEVVRRKILVEYLGDASIDLLSLLRLASTSLSWSKRVYGEVLLWKRIDFSKVDSAARDRLTDRLLLAFLRRVDSRYATEELSLASCHRLTGRGIGPLRGSKVLRKLDLRFVPTQGSRASDIDLESLQRTLGSIAPFSCGSTTKSGASAAAASAVTPKYPGLQAVYLPELQYGMDKRSHEVKLTYSSMIKTFHRSFIDISKESGTAFDCKTCKQPNGRKHFASNFVSYMAIRSVCTECDTNGPYCEFCGRVECPEWRICAICDDFSCNMCKGGALTCHQCSVTVGLNHDGEPWTREPPVALCSRCNKVACSTCRKQGRCSQCRSDFCASCSVLVRCSGCDGQYCTDCSRMSSCGACGDTFCNSSKCENDHFKTCVSSSYRRSAFI
mmetsp:Transcript_15332/g.33146  ORF Transcript_15332/g.33146 Transcript_15332/m.33146 type:complete len:422 (+) Transcript_15332:60-1325(+)